MFFTIRKIQLLFLVLFIFACLNFFYTASFSAFTEDYDTETIIKDLFIKKNDALATQNIEPLKNIYDQNSKFGVWAFEHEEKKMKYIHNWSEKQGIVFIEINPEVILRKTSLKNDIISANLLVSTEYKYTYTDDPENINSMRIGTYHTINIKLQNEQWVIIKEWYTDPFADSLNLDNLKTDSIKEFIFAQTSKDFSSLPKARLSAMEYAFKYSGAANEAQYGYTYNKKYGDFNPQGGDCANFASQIMFETGRFKKNSAWNFSKGSGTKAWLNAQGFKDYMINSGRASLIAYGNYEKVYKASYKLKPGDFVAYEKNGKVTHISTVTAADSKGYTLVNCHNTDRHKVPWDLGWSNKNIKFWLVSVHY